METCIQKQSTNRSSSLNSLVDSLRTERRTISIQLISFTGIRPRTSGTGAAPEDILGCHPFFSNDGELFVLRRSLWPCPSCSSASARDSHGRFGVIFSNDAARAPRDAPYHAPGVCSQSPRRFLYRSSDATCCPGRLSLTHYESPLERPK
jgi:hypothetical protein